MPYRIEIQQGNFVSQEMVSQLKRGMSKDQVRFVMGTALIADSFHADRWDYVFRRQKVNSRELEQRKLAVFFEDGKLVRIEGDVSPAAGADALGLKAPEARPAPAVTPPSKPTAERTSEVPKPAAATDKPADAPVASGDGKPQEKGWWERLKDKLSR